MAQLSVKLNDGWVTTSKKLKEGSRSLTANVLTRVATFMERTAKEKIQQSVYASPTGVYKRKGKARQSITRGVISPTQQRVFMGVNYGQYLEEGTGIYNGRKAYWTTFGGLLDHPIKYKGMKARPFWKPSIEETQENIPRILEEEASKLNK